VAKGRKSSGGTRFDPKRDFTARLPGGETVRVVVRKRPASLVPADQRNAWDYSWTLERLRGSQPDPFKKLVPVSLRNLNIVKRDLVATRPRIAPPPRAELRRVGDDLVDTRTGEIVEKKVIAGRDHYRSECERAKQDKRHFVISSGHGGNNGVRKYSKPKGC